MLIYNAKNVLYHRTLIQADLGYLNLHSSEIEKDCFIRVLSVQVYSLLQYFNEALYINVCTSGCI